MKRTMRHENKNLYNRWYRMKRRCFDPNNKDYKDYGGRGITICDEWLNFDNFCMWALENGYAANLTIERIDVNGNYEPNNCKWATLLEQANNKRRNHFIEYNGKKLTISQWARELNIQPTLIQSRIKKGLPVDKILSTKVRNRQKLITFNGKTLNIREWAKLTGLSEQVIGRRINKGWSAEKALTVSTKDGFFVGNNNGKNNHYITFNGKTLSLSDWAREVGISNKTISERLRNGWSIERALTEPTHNCKRRKEHEKKD